MRFRVEDVDNLSFAGELSMTRMGFRHFNEPTPSGQHGEYYSVDGIPLRDGLHAAVGAGPLIIRLSDEQARALLRFLRRIGKREIAAALDGDAGDTELFDEAREQLSAALAKSLGEQR